MTDEAYRKIMKKLDHLDDVARQECGCYVRECIWEVMNAVVEARREEEALKCS